MITEIRDLIFSREALIEVFRFHAEAPGSNLEAGSVVDVAITNAAEGTVAVTHHPRGARSNLTQSFTPAETVAAVIRYCQHHSVPIPREARKTLEVQGDKVHIRFIQDLEPVRDTG